MHKEQNNADYKYFNLVNNILTHGVVKTDRTGTGTLSLPFQQMRFDLSENKIPLLTTKKMFIRGIIHEIIWYLTGSANSKYLQDRDVKIWNEWSTPEGHLNKIYGFQWRKWENNNWMNEVVEIPIKSGGVDEIFIAPKQNIQAIQYNTNKDPLIGQSFKNTAGDQFVVLTKIESQNMYNVQFLETGTIIQTTRRKIQRAQIIDPYKKTIFQQGCLGIYNEQHTYRSAAYKMWYNMMRRCYDPKSPEFDYYGGKGVFVDQSWRCFSNFLRDIHDLVHFDGWKNEPTKFILDKDYFMSNCYSKQTCIFIPKEYKKYLLPQSGNKFIITNNKTKQQYESTIPHWFAKVHRIKPIRRIKLPPFPIFCVRGWTFEVISPRPGFVFRQRLFTDQIDDAINKLRINPTDRRIIISAWNVADIPQMKLPPCHTMFQFWSDNKYLSCHLYQRSCDVGLGVPFNIVQYSILTKMFAHITGLEAKEFIWTGGDVHIYNNHVEQLKDQLTRIPYQSPTLKPFKSSIKEIDDFRFEDFVIQEYQSHPAIKMEVSV